MSPDPLPSERTWRLTVVAGLAVFAAFRIAELTTYALWYDELFSISLAQREWTELLGAAVADRTNPPLFYLFLKAWMGVGGDSVAWVRLLPCLIGIAAAVPLAALARRASGESRAAVAVALASAAASPLLVALSNEVRGYSLLLLLSSTSLLAFWRLADAAEWQARSDDGDVPSARHQSVAEFRRRAVLFALTNVVLVYTHYFGWLVVAAEVAAAAIWRRRALRTTTLAAAAGAVAFAPWAAAVIINARSAARPFSNVDWISRPRPLDVLTFYDALIARVLSPGTAWIGAAVITATLLALVWGLLRTGRDSGPRRTAAEVALFAALPVVTVYAASLIGERSTFVPRYLVVAAPAWWILVGLAFAGHRSVGAGRRHVAAAAFAAFTLGAGVMREVRGGEKIAWDRVVAAIADDAGQRGGTIYSLEGFTALPLAFYGASAEVPLTVEPVRDLSAITPPAWLVVRARSNAGPLSLGDGLAPAGIRLEPVYTSAIPSHSITAYRVVSR